MSTTTRGSSDGAVLWGRDGFERSRVQKQRRDAYRRDLQEQIRIQSDRKKMNGVEGPFVKLPDLPDSRRENQRRSVVESQTISSVASRDSRRRVRPTALAPETNESTKRGEKLLSDDRKRSQSASDSNSNYRSEKDLMQQIAGRNAASIAEMLARIRRTEEDILKIRHGLTQESQSFSATESMDVQMKSVLVKLQHAEERDARFRERQENTQDQMKKEIATLKASLLSERSQHSKQQSVLLRRIERLEAVKSQDISSGGGSLVSPNARHRHLAFVETVKQLRGEFSQRLLSMEHTIAQAEARIKKDARSHDEIARVRDDDMTSLRGRLSEMENRLSGELLEARSVIERATKNASSEREFRNEIDRVNFEERNRATEKVVRELRNSVTREAQEWRQHLATLEKKIETRHQNAVEGIKHASFVNAESTVLLQQQLSDAIGSIAKAVANGRKSAGNEWSEWERGTAMALEALRQLFETSRAESKSRLASLEDVIRAEITTRMDDVESIHEQLRADRDEIRKKQLEMRKEHEEWSETKRVELRDDHERIDATIKRVNVVLKDSLATYRRDFDEYTIKLESFREEAGQLAEASRVFRSGQGALEEHQERVIASKIAKEIEDCEKRCAAECARKIAVMAKVSRAMIVEAQQKAIVTASDDTRRITKESSALVLLKLQRAAREVEASAAKARESMDVASRDAARLAIASESALLREILERETSRLDANICEISKAWKVSLAKRSDEIYRLLAATQDAIQVDISTTYDARLKQIEATRKSDLTDANAVAVRASGERRALEEVVEKLKVGIAAFRDECNNFCEGAIEKERAFRVREIDRMGHDIGLQSKHRIEAIQISLRATLSEEIATRNEHFRKSQMDLRQFTREVGEGVRSEQRVLAETVATRLQSMWSDMLKKIHEEKAGRLRGDATLRAKLIAQQQSTNELNLSSETQTRYIENALSLASKSAADSERRIRELEGDNEVRDVLFGVVNRVVDDAISTELDKRVTKTTFAKAIARVDSDRRLSAKNEKQNLATRICSSLLDRVVSNAVDACEEIRAAEAMSALTKQFRIEADVRNVLRGVVNRVADEQSSSWIQRVSIRVDSVERSVGSLHKTVRRADDEEFEMLEKAVTILKEREGDVSSVMS
eukprot:g4409.t1